MRVKIQSKIKLKLLTFTQSSDENYTYYFLPFSARELDLKKSGIDYLKKVLKIEYQNLHNGVQTNTNHKIVYEQIQKIVLGYQKKERKKSKKLTEEETRKKENIFIDVLQLKNNILLYGEEQKKLVDNIEKILQDLHRLGLIVYLNNSSVRDLIITDPKWFNNVFKNILDFGKMRIANIFEQIKTNLEQMELKGKSFFFFILLFF